MCECECVLIVAIFSRAVQFSNISEIQTGAFNSLSQLESL